MGSIVQDLTFTRYIYKLSYSHSYFNEFILENRINLFSRFSNNEFELSLRVQIEPFKGKGGSKTKAPLYFKLTMGSDYVDVTGMRPTKYNNIYYGDVIFPVDNKKKKVLILFQVIKVNELLVVDVFDSYYPKTNKERKKLINQHLWHEKTTRKESGLKSFKTYTATNE